jgi:hypothetical protein
LGSHPATLALYDEDRNQVSSHEITQEQVNLIGDLIGWGAIIDATSLIFFKDEQLLPLVEEIAALSDIAAWLKEQPIS